MSAPAAPSGPAVPVLADVWQRSAWLLATMHGGSRVPLARAARIDGVVVDRLADRLTALVARHPALCTGFRVVAGEPQPVALAPVMDFGTVRVPAAELDAAMLAAAREPVDLGTGPLLRARLYPQDGHHVLLLAVPESTVDHLSLAALWAEVLGRPAVPARTGVDDDADRDWWRDRLSAPAGTVDLAPGRAVQRGHGADRMLPVTADPSDTAQVEVALRAVLRRYTGVADFLLGLPVAAHRDDPVSARGTVLRSAGGDLAEVVAHAGLPDRELFTGVEPGRAAWNVALVGADLLVPGVTDEVLLDLALGMPSTVGVPLGECWWPGDLAVLVGPHGIRLCYDHRVVDAGLARCLAEDLAATLRTGSVPATVALERTVAPDLAAAHRAHPDFRRVSPAGCVPERFAEQVARHPDRPAVLADDGSLTYRQLAGAAGGVARALTGAAGTRVALLLGHGVRPVAAMLGVLAAGASYVPLDPAYPADRLAAMLRHSGAEVLLADAGTWSLGQALCAQVPAARMLDVTALGDAPLRVADGTTPDSEAYVLYTSGSTGTPKGVVQNHRNLLFAATNHIGNFRICPADRVAVLSSFSFDMAVTDMYSAVLSGAAAVPVDVRGRGMTELAEVLAERAVSVYHSTPTVYRHLVEVLGADGRLPGIRAVLLGGEEVTPHDVAAYRRHFAPDGVFVNGYGATEISFITQHHVPADQQIGTRLPVGHPLAGIEVRLCAPDGTPAALTGEIVVRSRHVATGYADGGGFTDRGAGVREHRTGDLGCRQPDGALLHLGRVDRQVKIRGYRVELGEIEAALAGLPQVAQAAAVARDGRLVGYVRPADGTVRPQELVRALAQRLPHFMVPQAVVLLDELPTTPTGKLDVRALPDPAPPGSAAHPTPDDPVERSVAAAWCAELGVAAVGTDENFFDLGGHSLLLARVQQRLEAELSVRIPLARMFEYPTVAAQARFLAGTPGPAAPDLRRVDDRMARRRAARGGRR